MLTSTESMRKLDLETSTLQHKLPREEAGLVIWDSYYPVLIPQLQDHSSLIQAPQAIDRPSPQQIK